MILGDLICLNCSLPTAAVAGWSDFCYDCCPWWNHSRRSNSLETCRCSINLLFDCWFDRSISHFQIICGISTTRIACIISSWAFVGMALYKAWIEFWSCQAYPWFECKTLQSNILWDSSTTMDCRRGWSSSCQAGRSPCFHGSSVAIMTFGSRFSSHLDLFQSIENWHVSNTRSVYFGSWFVF